MKNSIFHLALNSLLIAIPFTGAVFKEANTFILKIEQ